MCEPTGVGISVYATTVPLKGTALDSLLLMGADRKLSIETFVDHVMALDDLLAGRLDIVLAHGPIPRKGVETFDVWDEPVMLAVPEGHRLAGHPSVTVSDLRGELVAAPAARHQPWMHQQIYGRLVRAGARLRPIVSKSAPIISVIHWGNSLWVISPRATAALSAVNSPRRVFAPELLYLSGVRVHLACCLDDMRERRVVGALLHSATADRAFSPSPIRGGSPGILAGMHGIRRRMEAGRSSTGALRAWSGCRAAGAAARGEYAEPVKVVACRICVADCLFVRVALHQPQHRHRRVRPDLGVGRVEIGEAYPQRFGEVLLPGGGTAEHGGRERLGGVAHAHQCGEQPARDFPQIVGQYLNGELKLDELVTRRRPLTEINEVVADLTAGIGIRTVFTF